MYGICGPFGPFRGNPFVTTPYSLEAGEGWVPAAHADVHIKQIGWKKPQDCSLSQWEIRRAKPQDGSCQLRLRFGIARNISYGTTCAWWRISYLDENRSSRPIPPFDPSECCERYVCRIRLREIRPKSAPRQGSQIWTPGT